MKRGHAALRRSWQLAQLCTSGALARVSKIVVGVMSGWAMPSAVELLQPGARASHQRPSEGWRCSAWSLLAWSRICLITNSLPPFTC